MDNVFPNTENMDEWDWEALWEYASPLFHDDQVPPAETAPIRYQDVAEVVAHWDENPEGWNDRNVVALFRLHDGRFATVEAWCDTTGWDCQSGAVFVIGDRERVIKFGLGDEARKNLGLQEDIS